MIGMGRIYVLCSLRNEIFIIIQDFWGSVMIQGTLTMLCDLYQTLSTTLVPALHTLVMSVTREEGLQHVSVMMYGHRY